MTLLNIRYISKRLSIFLFIVLLLGFIIPQNFVIPVENATSENWDIESFWYWPWGESITHKGVDIFSPEGTNVFSSTIGIVLTTKTTGNGGNIVYILGPKWRIHYYAHLQEISTKRFCLVNKGELIGKVGKTGNAANRPPHLHYSIKTYFPYFWLWDDDIQGWQKMFYLNPLDYMNECLEKSKDVQKGNE
jgi:peptidoglycan LD-endopeptidase LytH